MEIIMYMPFIIIFIWIVLSMIPPAETPKKKKVVRKLSKEKLDKLERNREVQQFLRLRRHKLHTMPYRKYLLTPEWKQKSYDAKVRAGFKCQLCGASEKLHVHHDTYKRRGYEADDDLRVLCSACHYDLHKADIKWRLERDKIN